MASPFLSLSFELRQEIYKHLLTADDIQVLTLEDTWGLHPAILRVNKQIYNEALEVLYQSTGWIALTGLDWNEYCQIGGRSRNNSDAVLRAESLKGLMGTIPLRQLQGYHSVPSARSVHLEHLESQDWRCGIYTGPAFIAPALAMPHLMLLIEAIEYDCTWSVVIEDDGSLQTLCLNQFPSWRHSIEMLRRPSKNYAKIGVLEYIFIIERSWMTDISGLWNEVWRQTLVNCRSWTACESRLTYMGDVVCDHQGSLTRYEEACISIHAIRLQAWFQSIVEKDIIDRSVTDDLQFFIRTAITYCRSVGNLASVKVILTWYRELKDD